MRKPDFFIVGGPRCATTSMRNYLHEHPDIFMAPTGHGNHLFGSDLYRPNLIRDEESYLSLFDEAKDEKRVGERSAHYLHSKRAAAEIKEFMPSARIIIMLRNPVDVICSMHSLYVYNGLEDIVDFGAALDAEEDRSRGLLLPKGVGLQEAWRFLYREKAQFAEQVQRCLDVFGPENVHIIIFDDFVRDTARVYEETLSFLDVSPFFPPEFRKFNANRRVRSGALHRFIKRPPRPVRSFVKNVTPFQLLQRMVNGLVQLNTKHAPSSPLTQELRKQLQSEFLPGVERLSELLGRDLTHWCQS